MKPDSRELGRPQALIHTLIEVIRYGIVIELDAHGRSLLPDGQEVRDVEGMMGCRNRKGPDFCGACVAEILEFQIRQRGKHQAASFRTLLLEQLHEQYPQRGLGLQHSQDIGLSPDRDRQALR